MKLVRKTYLTRSEKIGDFVIGFVGWFVVNAVLGGLLTLGNGVVNAVITSTFSDFSTAQNILLAVWIVCTCLPLIGNVAALIYLARTRYWIALGALAAFAISLLIVLCISIFIGVTCFAVLGGLNSTFIPTPTP